MKKIKCIAIDDEPLALLVISQFCERKGNIELTTYCEPKIGLEEIIRKKPDLVFLDIEMNSISGLDIAHILPHDTCFIFTTAHAQYALDGFDLNATDFLHKPFSYERFEKAIEKAFRYIENIPNRVTDGYGLNVNAIERLIGKGMELLITCDNGIAAIEEIKYAKEKGIDVVIYDHHEPVIKDDKEILPEADSVTDAKIENCGYDFTVMCAGGLCYRVMKSFYEYLGQKYTLEKEMIIFAGIATVCDVVDLVGENRAIAKRSLELINDNIENTGLRHLVDINSLESINEFHYGFVLGPCINACGRLEDASIAVELFIEENEAKASELALKLFELNAERKAITLDSTDRIINEVENSNLIEDKILVVYDKELHESIAGIVAGRLKERYNKPAIVLTKSEKGVKGSCRSIDKYNIFEALNKEKEYLGKFGGHKLAAGLSLPEENVEKFRCSINQHCSLNKEDFEQVFYIDGQLPFDFISLDGAEELDIMHPFGISNTKPIFGTKDLTCRNIRFLGENKTIVAMELADKSGNSNRAIMFNGGDRIEDILLKKNYSKENCRDAEINIDALYTLEINEYKDYRNVQLNIKDFREI